jgi:hypothetical protein
MIAFFGSSTFQTLLVLIKISIGVVNEGAAAFPFLK